LVCTQLIHIWNHTMINWTINLPRFQKDRNILWILKWYYTEQDNTRKFYATKLLLYCGFWSGTIQSKITPRSPRHQSCRWIQISPNFTQYQC
jgi:hypothetical protein